MERLEGKSVLRIAKMKGEVSACEQLGKSLLVAGAISQLHSLTPHGLILNECNRLLSTVVGSSSFYNPSVMRLHVTYIESKAEVVNGRGARPRRGFELLSPDCI